MNLFQLPERFRRRWMRRLSYRDCFLNGAGELTPAGAAVIKDLVKFCGPYKSTVKLTLNRSIDTHAMAVAEGRREVFLHVLAILKVTEDDILKSAEGETE